MRWVGLNEAHDTQQIWHMADRYGGVQREKKCRGHQAGKTTNTVSLCGLRHVLELNRSGGASGRLPQRPKGGLWRTGWWGCGSQHGLIDTWFGRKLWLDLHVHESMFVFKLFKFQHGHPYQTRTLFYTGTHVPLPMNPRNVNYIYLFFLPPVYIRYIGRNNQICTTHTDLYMYRLL